MMAAQEGPRIKSRGDVHLEEPAPLAWVAAALRWYSYSLDLYPWDKGFLS